VKLDLKLTRDILVNFIKLETEKIGLENIVIGLSGGIDSAVSAALASLAMDNKKVYAYGLPYKTSSIESIEDAKMVAEKLGINFEVIDITSFVDKYCELDSGISRLRKGNIMARMRMTVIFDKSSLKNALVLGTSNKTELLLGYGTWHGDMASSINPIGDLYKTQLWELAGFLDIPEKIIKKEPTADLWVGQTDEQELGYSYTEIDKLLFAMVDERRDEKELLGMGFTENIIKKIANRIKKTQFKRQLPIIAKISLRTIDKDFRYCRDWGY